MQAPGVGWVAADLAGPIEGWPFLRSVVGLVLDIRLLAVQLVAERRGSLGPGPAGILPLCFRGQPELPAFGKITGPPAQFGQLLAEPLSLGKVDVAHGVVVPLGQLARQLHHDPLPLPLRDLVLAGPETLRQPHLDLIFTRAAFRFVRRAAHRELARRTPAQLDPRHCALFAGPGAGECWRGRLWFRLLGGFPRDAALTAKTDGKEDEQPLQECVCHDASPTVDLVLFYSAGSSRRSGKS